MKPSLRQELDNGLVLSAESYAFEGAPEGIDNFYLNYEHFLLQILTLSVFL